MDFRGRCLDVVGRVLCGGNFILVCCLAAGLQGPAMGVEMDGHSILATR